MSASVDSPTPDDPGASGADDGSRRPTAAVLDLDVVGDRNRLAALLSPLRRELLEALGQEPASAAGLARRMGLSRQKVNYHLRELERTGFVELAEERRRRGCIGRALRPTASALCIDPAVLGGLAVDPSAVQDRFSSAYLLALASRMAADVSSLRRGAAAAQQSLPTISMETEVSFRSPAERAAFANELADALATLTAKYHDDGEGSRAVRFVVGGHPVVKSPPTSTTSPLQPPTTTPPRTTTNHGPDAPPDGTSPATDN